MTRRLGISLLLCTPLLLSALPAAAETPSPLPVIDGREALAVVNGEPITVDAFFRNLVALHDSVEAPGERPKQDPAELLDRLINIRLVLQEARNIGLDELPRMQQAFEAYREDALKELLFRDHVLRIGDVDPQEVQRRYRERVREFRVRSIVAPSREDAVDLATRVRQGEAFDELAGALVDTGGGEAGNPEEFLPASKMLPGVLDAVSAMQIDDVSDPIPIGEEFAVIQLLEVRYPDDPDVRARLEQEILQKQRADALLAYTEELREKYAKIDEKLFDSLDFEAAEPGFEGYEEDDRVVARVKGEPPVLVRDLAAAVRGEFFHGIEGAIASKKVNDRKTPQLYRLLQKRVILHEARRLGLDQTEDYATLLEEFESSLLFRSFLQRIVEPEIRINDQEMQDYLAANSEEFSSPEMMRIEALAFETSEAAEAAVAILRDGADFGWVRDNSDGVVDLSEDPSLLRFPKNLVVTALLPAPVGEAVKGATSGEFRLHSPESGPAYVLRIREVVPPVAQPFEAVKQTVVQRVYAQKRQDAVEEWFRQLREASDVEIFGTPDVLNGMLRGMMNEGL